MCYTLTQLVQRYHQRLVLSIDRLEIEAGRIHALLGPNGAGKTTLLHILAFLATPAGGTMTFNGEPVDLSASHLLQLRRRVVLVDQHPIMFSTTVRGNIEFGLKIRRVGTRERLRIVDEVLDLVGLDRYKTAAAHELSGGETQRLALARALALRPEVLLCDEPTASVDAENQAIIAALLQQINAERGTTIVFTTHDRLQAASLAQRTLVLENGRLARTTHENAFACSFRQDGGAPDGPPRCMLHGLVAFPLPPLRTCWPARRDGRIHLDPERITLCRAEERPDVVPTFTGTVVLVMAEDNRIRVVVNIGVLLVVLMPQDHYRRENPRVGDRVGLHVAPEGITLLD